MKRATVHIGEEDGRRLIEADYDTRYTRDYPAIAGAAEYAGALALSHARLTEARGRLVEAVAGLSREYAETDRARVELDLVRAKSKAIYGWARAKAHDQLNVIDPDQELPLEEIARRERLHTRLFPVSPSDFGDLEAPKQHAQLQASAAILREPQTTAEMGEAGRALAARLEAAAERLHGQREVWLTESEEDSEAMKALVAARAGLDAQHSFHVQLVELLLKDNGKSDEIKRRIKRRDPAYRARLDAGKSVREEPGLADVESEVDRATNPAGPPVTPNPEN